MGSSFWWNDILYAWVNTKALVISSGRVRRFCNLWRSSMVMFIFEDTIFRYSSNINLVLSVIPRCFWDDDWETLASLVSWLFELVW